MSECGSPQNFVECAGTQSCLAFISRSSSTVMTNGGDQPGSAHACRLAATRLLQPLRTSAERSRISSGVGSDESRSKDFDFLDTSPSRLETWKESDARCVSHVLVRHCTTRARSQKIAKIRFFAVSSAAATLTFAPTGQNAPTNSVQTAAGKEPKQASTKESRQSNEPELE